MVILTNIYKIISLLIIDNCNEKINIKICISILWFYADFKNNIIEIISKIINLNQKYLSNYKQISRIKLRAFSGLSDLSENG